MTQLADITPGQRLTIADAWDRNMYTGKVLKIYSAGFTMEDTRQIIHFCKPDRIRDVSPPEPRRAVSSAGDGWDLFQ